MLEAWRLLSERLEIKRRLPESVGERGASAAETERERVNRSLKHFLVQSRGSLAAVARGSAHIKRRGSLMHRLWGRIGPRRCMEVTGGHASRGRPFFFLSFFFLLFSLSSLQQLIRSSILIPTFSFTASLCEEFLLLVVMKS